MQLAALATPARTSPEAAFASAAQGMLEDAQPVPPAAVDEYYGPADGKRGVELLRSLHDISTMYHRGSSYADARSRMFRYVADPTDTNVVTELYSGRTVQGVSGISAATKAGLTTEHVWPQSEGATEIARSDLHHLRPADSKLNIYRSNLPYGVVKDAVWASPAVDGVKELSLVGTDREGRKVFTPRSSMRGDLARDQLYFFTRYHLAKGTDAGRPDGYSLDNFRVSLPTLLKWHVEDPVDEAERTRNETIFRLQGNRNPYVDRPELVEQVGFDPDLLGRALLAPDR